MKINLSFKEFKNNHSKKNIKFYLDQDLVINITRLKTYLDFS